MTLAFVIFLPRLRPFWVGGISGSQGWLSSLTNAVDTEVAPFFSAYLPAQQGHSFHPSYPTPMCVCVCVCVCSVVFYSLWHPLQAPLSMRFPRQEYWSRLPFPPPGSLPDPGIKPESAAWQVDFLPLGHLGCLLLTCCGWIFAVFYQTKWASCIIIFLK